MAGDDKDESTQGKTPNTKKNMLNDAMEARRRGIQGTGEDVGGEPENDDWEFDDFDETAHFQNQTSTPPSSPTTPKTGVAGGGLQDILQKRMGFEKKSPEVAQEKSEIGGDKVAAMREQLLRQKEQQRLKSEQQQEQSKVSEPVKVSSDAPVAPPAPQIEGAKQPQQDTTPVSQDPVQEQTQVQLKNPEDKQPQGVVREPKRGVQTSLNEAPTKSATQAAPEQPERYLPPDRQPDIYDLGQGFNEHQEKPKPSPTLSEPPKSPPDIEIPKGESVDKGEQPEQGAEETSNPFLHAMDENARKELIRLATDTADDLETNGQPVAPPIPPKPQTGRGSTTAQNVQAEQKQKSFMKEAKSIVSDTVKGIKSMIKDESLTPERLAMEIKQLDKRMTEFENNQNLFNTDNIRKSIGRCSKNIAKHLKNISKVKQDTPKG